MNTLINPVEPFLRGGQVPLRRRVIGHQPEMVAEAQHEGAVAGTQHGIQKGLQILYYDFYSLFLNKSSLYHPYQE